MSSQLPQFDNERLNQIVREDIPWRFRAACVLGTNPFNLTSEIEALIDKGALISKTGHSTKIIRRCETDAIEFGAYASIRWLLELLEIKFYPSGDQQTYKGKKDSNIWLRDLCPELKSPFIEIQKLGAEFGFKFELEYKILSAHGSHPSKNFDIPKIDPERIDQLLAFIEGILIKYIYKTSKNFSQLWFREREGDPAADKPRVNFNA